MIVATRNRHKTREIGAILGLRCLSLEDLPAAPPLTEEAETFAGNAAAKALQLARWLISQRESPPRLADLPLDDTKHGRVLVLADDSGLVVDALGGAPGIYSARYAARESGWLGNSTDAENNTKLLERLAHIPEGRRTARFRCALAVVIVSPPASLSEPSLFEGVCEGRIGFAPSGAGGFGYDPLFIPNGCTQSFAELDASFKNEISHRARALARLRAWLGHAS
jgi:XTP/dITP diphosphohydrolase